MAVGVSYDSSNALLVAVRDPTPSASEYAEMLEHMQRLDSDASRSALAPICILVVHPGTPAPSAEWRKRYADQAKSSKCPELMFALVTDSTLQRGVLTAIRWLTGETRGTSVAFATFREARTAAERMRKRPLPELEKLHAQAEQDLRSRA